MKIAIYGGSFNPPHLGHIEAARTVYGELSPDIFLIVPDNVPPHKDLEEGSPCAAERMELCKLAFGGLPAVVISDIELKRDGKSYTADTISALREEYKEDELCLVMGTDMFLSLESWYRFEYLLENCTITVLAREDEDARQLEAHANALQARYGANTLILPHAPLPMSSSEIRGKLRLRMGAEQLAPGVYKRIIQKGYYDALPELAWLREQVYERIEERRIAHVVGCESEAVLLAMHWGESPETAATAAILHDITKKLNTQEQLKLCEKYGIICDNADMYATKLLHAKTGAELARDEFGVSDAIYQAIRWHTTGRPDMSVLEKIIYIADYIEPTRDFPGIERLRKLAYEDLNMTMIIGMKMSLDDILSRGIEPHTDTIDAYNWYCAQAD